MKLIQQFSFRGKIIFTVFMACLVCGLIAVGVAVHYKDIEFYRGLESNARLIHGRLEEVAKYVALQGGLKPMIERYTAKYKDSSELTKEDQLIILQQVPIYASMKIGSENADRDHYQFRVFSNEPRNKKNAASREELEVFKKFEANPGLKELVVTNSRTVTVFRPVIISEKQNCLACHGDPAQSPWKNGKDILGFPMENWKDGKMHGVFAVSHDVDEVRKAVAAKGEISSTWMLGLYIFAGGLLALFLAFLIVKGPLKILTLVGERISQAGNEVTEASTKIKDSSVSLSEATTEQAASLTETASSLEQISAMIDKATESAAGAAQASTESQKKAELGQRAVNQVVNSMNLIQESNERIKTQVEESNQKMSEIVRVIQEIGTKTKVINEIVFQTKLLSFNASVEAARAGEHGKGFAVVAEEVGNLAQMSGNAAKEISDMLGSSISKVESIVDETKLKVESLVEDGKEKVNTGIQVAEDCSRVLNEIVAEVTKVTGLAQEISQASREQSQGVGEINNAMRQLDVVTQQNTASSRETAHTAEQLSQQAQILQSAMLELSETLGGHRNLRNNKVDELEKYSVKSGAQTNSRHAA